MGDAYSDGTLCNWVCGVFYQKNIEMIDSRLKNFILKIAIAAVILALAATGIFTFIAPGEYIPVLPWMLLFFMAVTILIHGYQLSLIRKDLGKFTRRSMIISMLRLFIYSFIAIGYLITDSDNVPVFIVSLVIIYMVFTIIEIKAITRTMKGKR